MIIIVSIHNNDLKRKRLHLYFVFLVVDSDIFLAVTSIIALFFCPTTLQSSFST